MVNGTDLGLPTDETMSCLNPANADSFATIDEAHCNPMTPIKLKIKLNNPNAFEIVIKRVQPTLLLMVIPFCPSVLSPITHSSCQSVHVK